MIPPQKREQKHNYFSFNMACAENFAYLRDTGIYDININTKLVLYIYIYIYMLLIFQKFMLM